MRISSIRHRALLLLLLALFRPCRVPKRRRHVIRIIGRGFDNDVVRILECFRMGLLFCWIVFSVRGRGCRSRLAGRPWRVRFYVTMHVRRAIPLSRRYHSMILRYCLCGACIGLYRRKGYHRIRLAIQERSHGRGRQRQRQELRDFCSKGVQIVRALLHRYSDCKRNVLCQLKRDGRQENAPELGISNSNVPSGIHPPLLTGFRLSQLNRSATRPHRRHFSLAGPGGD